LDLSNTRRPGVVRGALVAEGRFQDHLRNSLRCIGIGTLLTRTQRFVLEAMSVLMWRGVAVDPVWGGRRLQIQILLSDMDGERQYESTIRPDRKMAHAGFLDRPQEVEAADGPILGG
jgi:hypothetical protein